MGACELFNACGPLLGAVPVVESECCGRESLSISLSHSVGEEGAAHCIYSHVMNETHQR